MQRDDFAALFNHGRPPVTIRLSIRLCMNLPHPTMMIYRLAAAWCNGRQLRARIGCMSNPMLGHRGSRWDNGA